MGLFKKSLTNLSSFLAILETSDADMFFNPNFENTFVNAGIKLSNYGGIKLSSST